MTASFRARQWGAANWTYITIEPDDEDDLVADALQQIIGSALGTSSLHVQIQVDGEWEDLE